MTPRFFILELAEILALLGECIYLQLIELKFCNFDANLNKNIINRSKKESIMIPLNTKYDNDSNSSFVEKDNVEDRVSQSSENLSINS